MLFSVYELAVNMWGHTKGVYRSGVVQNEMERWIGVQRGRLEHDVGGWVIAHPSRGE
jgi:hypothetical protein